MKTNLPILLLLVVVFMFAGCVKTIDMGSTEQSSTAQASTQTSTDQTTTSSEQSSTVYTTTDYSVFEGPESAYRAFLSNLYSGDEDPRILYEKKDVDAYSDQAWVTKEYYYTFKDLDNDGIPELLFMAWGNVTVYTFNKGLIKVGNRNFVSGTTRLFFSDNPAYPGIFNFHLGGGLERYGYTCIKDNQLFYEELWNEDYSGWRENRIEEHSKDKGLIRESKALYSKGNDIEWVEVSLDDWPSP